MSTQSLTFRFENGVEHFWCATKEIIDFLVDRISYITNDQCRNILLFNVPNESENVVEGRPKGKCLYVRNCGCYQRREDSPSPVEAEVQFIAFASDSSEEETNKMMS